MLRRPPEAILIALRMDPERVELYVEGERDRTFLLWIIGASTASAPRVIPMAFVESPGLTDGGERGRLFHFAQQVDSAEERIRFFADADFDRLLNRDVPPLIWLTDFRDLEGYVLSLDCIDRVLRLGLATDEPTASQVLQVVHDYGRKLGILRLLSEKQGMGLPFQQTNIRRHLRWNRGKFELRFHAYLQSLLQNSGTKLTRLNEIKAALVDLHIEEEHTADAQIIHGKDALCIVERFLQKSGVREGEAERLLWSSFERSNAYTFPNLNQVVSYLRGSESV